MGESWLSTVKEEVVLAGPYTASMPRTKKVFAVVDLTCSVDYVGLKFQGLVKDNMPPFGDIMVSVSSVLGQYHSARYSCATTFLRDLPSHHHA